MHPWDVSPKEAIEIQKSLLEKGSFVPLTDKGEQIGVVLRTNAKPLYISPGHRVSIESAHWFIMKCVTRYRLPETTRWAHKPASG